MQAYRSGTPTCMRGRSPLGSEDPEPSRVTVSPSSGTGGPEADASGGSLTLLRTRTVTASWPSLPSTSRTVSVKSIVRVLRCDRSGAANVVTLPVRGGAA